MLAVAACDEAEHRYRVPRQGRVLEQPRCLPQPNKAAREENKYVNIEYKIL